MWEGSLQRQTFVLKSKIILFNPKRLSDVFQTQQTLNKTHQSLLVSSLHEITNSGLAEIIFNRRVRCESIIRRTRGTADVRELARENSVERRNIFTGHYDWRDLNMSEFIRFWYRLYVTKDGDGNGNSVETY